MTDENLQLYEGLFLFNIQAINGEMSTAIDHLKEILARAEAEVETISKWDEARLAYPIRGQKRGLYLLSYFRVRPIQVANIERDVNLSELLLRCLIIKAEHVGDVELEAIKADARKTSDEVAVRGESAPAADAPAPATATAEAPAPTTEAPAPAEPEAPASPAPAEEADNDPTRSAE